MLTIWVGLPAFSAAMSPSSATIRRSAMVIRRSILGWSSISVSCHAGGGFLVLQELALNGFGQTEAAALHNGFAILLYHQGTEHFFAFAAIGGAVGGDAGKHRTQKLGDEHA